ncbi:hypothetical protein KIW84_041121 [Lathyrus oleraceus]|uniref:Uncharacterized protein n=1 Tax=Pisum sativum TaxID=3888 RepID=A0A9D4X946_PEA|nr:hypothetical protein KIW84_041121 [Pisum sativum]
MDTSKDPSALYLYLHLPVVYYLGVLVPFTSFKIELLTVVNVAPSQVNQNAWGILKAFQIMCCHFRVSPPARVLLYFFWMNPFPCSVWKALQPFPEGVNHASPVMVGVAGEILFPFSWTSDPKAIVRVDSCVFPPLDFEVIEAMKCFLPLECSILIARDREDVCYMQVKGWWYLSMKNESAWYKFRRLINGRCDIFPMGLIPLWEHYEVKPCEKQIPIPLLPQGRE